MNPRKYLVLAVLAAVLSLSSCSGVKTVCTTNCTVGSNGSLNLTLAAEPFTPPPNTSILSFAVLINSVSLTPSAGGSDVTIPLNTSSFGVDLTRLQSDSAFLGQFINSVPTGTYNQLSVNLNAVVTYCAATSGTPGCNSGSIAQISKAFTSATTSNFSFTMGANQQAGLRVVINFANALTVNPATQAVTAIDLTAANVATTTTLPPVLSTLSSGQFDYVEDVTGVITATTSSSVTVQTATRGPITAVITGSTLFSQNCVVLNNTCTPTVGQVASIDGTLNADGTSTMLLFDPLTATSVDLIEGIVTSETTSSTQFQMVVNDLVKANSNSKIGAVSLGDTVNVTLSGLVGGFFVDGKGLPLTASNFSGSNSATDIHTGQTVMFRVTAFTPKAGSTPASATADAVVLRFTRFAANAAGAGSVQFSIASLPPFFGFTTQPLVQLGNGNPITYLDGYTSNGAITSGDHLGIRALYFGTNVAPSFSAAKIRKN
ncbi:MAG TPA: hypothetical protein VFI45_11205 [Candidatus Acidoferrum sp.]|nr:hypothetical protein [Candidatus Acidoferrum sp.]